MTMFFRNNSVGDRRADPMDRWHSKESCLSTIYKLVWSFLYFNSSSVASESWFSLAEHLVGDLCTRRSDEIISASLLMKS